MIVTIHGSEAATRGVLKKLCSQKFRKNQRKTPVPVTLFFFESLAQAFSCEFCKIFKNTSFTEHPRTTTSEGFKV